MLNLKLNAGDKKNQELTEKYNINGVPHLLFVDKDGNEIDRIVGYLPPDKYAARLIDIQNNVNTLSDFINRYKSNPEDFEVLTGLGAKYEDKGDFEKSVEIYSELIKHHGENTSEKVNRARYFLAMQDLFNGDKTTIEEFIRQYPESQYIHDAYSQMVRYYAVSEESSHEIAVLDEFVTKFPDDPNALNQYAWRMTELNKNLEKALEFATKAVDLTVDDPKSQANILDTKAELLWKLGRNDEAVQTIEKAIIIEPAYDYLQKQKEKFLNN